MCGRYSISKKAREIADFFEVSPPDNFSGAIYNAAPTQLLPAIALNQPHKLQLFKWGLLASWSNESASQPLLINARAESLFEKKMFAPLVQTNRCLVPADGFYEWERVGKTKQPWRFTLADDGIFAFAAIFSNTVYKNGQIGHTFAIITTGANQLVSPVHDRMPVILDRETSQSWLEAGNPHEIQQILKPFQADKMKSYKVSPKINSAAANSPDLINPWQDPTLTLF